MLQKDGPAPQTCAGHARVEFPRFAIDVKIGVRKIRRQHWCAKHHCATKQLVDLAVLRMVDSVVVEPDHGQEALGIVAGAMRGAKTKGPRRSVHD